MVSIPHFQERSGQLRSGPETYHNFVKQTDDTSLELGAGQVKF